METSNGIDYGTESDEQADADAVDVDPDVWAYVDGGEYATTWAVERFGHDSVVVETHRHEAGLDEVDGDLRTFDVDPEESTEEWARKYAREHTGSVNIARDYYANK